jgi:thiamine biosynthesis protein ThiS
MAEEISLNGEARAFRTGETLLDLLAALGRDPRTVAIEKNGAIVPRSEYGAAPLAAGDRIEIVHFVQGG